MGNKLKRLFQHNSLSKRKARNKHLERLNKEVLSIERYINNNPGLDHNILRSFNNYLNSLHKEIENLKSKLNATTF